MHATQIGTTAGQEATHVLVMSNATVIFTPAATARQPAISLAPRALSTKYNTFIVFDCQENLTIFSEFLTIMIHFTSSV